MKITPAFTRLNPKAGKPVKFGFKFPEDFILVVDTREQESLFTNRPPKGLVMVRDYLEVGDYSARGFEKGGITIERKTVPDLLNCLGNDRERFKRELEKMRGYEWKAIVVESSENDLLQHHEISLMEPESIRQSIVSINIRYRVQFYYQPVREKMERWVLDHLIKFFLVKRVG